MILNGILILIVVLLVWIGLVLRHWLPKVGTARGIDPTTAGAHHAQLHLCDPHGALEHEISWHRPQLKNPYEYPTGSGNLYKVVKHHQIGKELIVEYRR